MRIEMLRNVGQSHEQSRHVHVRWPLLLHNVMCADSEATISTCSVAAALIIWTWLQTPRASNPPRVDAAMVMA
jgi:hypothetical protein